MRGSAQTSVSDLPPQRVGEPDKPAFPLQSTADQWFNELQFEAYRALGAHIVERICAGSKNVAPGTNPPALDVESLKERCEEYLAAARLRPSPPSCCAQS